MTDRELLEAAAKAAGIEVHTIEDADGVVHWDGWNPLADDGDALRLAVRLRMQIDILDRSVYALAMNGAKVCELDRADIGAATRRAITRAAAEIGRAMK
jgi:hypothetical protein